jgi:hypothetical protein
LAEGERFLLELNCLDGSNLFVPAYVCWTISNHGWFTSGCKFLGNNGFDAFHKVVES